MHEERKTKKKNNEEVPEGAVPAYLLDREGQTRAKVLSNMVKQKRKEKAVSYCCGIVDNINFLEHHTRSVPFYLSLFGKLARCQLVCFND